MRRNIGFAGLVAWVAATLVAFLLMRRGVIQEPVCFQMADGTRICGTLCRPRSAKTNLPVAVLLHGVAFSHQSCVPGLALPLARHGYLALAIDLCGHGRSGGSVPRAELDSIAAQATHMADHAEVDAALDYIQRLPLFSGQGPCACFHRIGLVGHSRGGWIAAQTAIRRPDVEGVIAIGAAPLVCDTSRPRNLLFLSGGQDLVCPLEKGVEAMLQATGGAVCKPNVAFGDFGAGNARRLTCVRTAEHLTEMANSTVSARTVEWLDSALHLDLGNRRADNDVAYLLTACLAASLGGLAGCTAILGALGQRLLPENRQEWQGANGWRMLAFGLLLMGTVPVAASASRWFEIGPVYFCGPSVLLFASMAGGCALVAARHQPTSESFFGCLRNAPRRGILLGAIALAVGGILLGAPWGITWYEFVPTTSRLPLAFVLFVALLPASLVLAWGLQRLTGDRHPYVAWLAWLAVACVLCLTNHFLVESRHPMFTVPARLIFTSFALPWPLWLLRYRPGLMLARGISHAGALAWLLACHLPFVNAD